jgi:hypothetical protein
MMDIKHWVAGFGRLPVRFSFAANKPEKSRKPSAPAPLCERQIRLGRISASSN